MVVVSWMSNVRSKQRITLGRLKKNYISVLLALLLIPHI